MSDLVIGDLCWRPIATSDADALVAALDDPEVARWLGGAASGVARRLAADRAGSAFTLVAHRDDVPLGWSGVLDYPGLAGTLQSSFYFAASARGTGLWTPAAVLAASIADLLTPGMALVHSTHHENARSQAAIAKGYPDAPPEMVDEPWLPRRARIFRTRGLPRGGIALDAGQHARLVGLLAAAPIARVRAFGAS